jgi:glycosyltransferase involved in cell wall biosynthesis
MKASIVIRAYNAEKTLARCVRSALAQNEGDEYEVVVVNDGSEDGTAQVIREFSADPRVRVVEQENQGLIGASNAGFAAAQGNIVMLLDADDEALPDFVSASCAALRDPSVDYGYGEYYEEYEGVRKLIRPGDPFQALAGAFVWRREKLMAEGGFGNGSIFPEYEILLRTWGRWHGVPIPQPLFVYHRSRSSMTGDSGLVQKSIDMLRKKYPERALEIAAIRSYEL